MKTEHLSPPALVMLSPNKTKEINQNGAPVLGVREGYLVGMMLKPRAEGAGRTEKERLSHFALAWGEDIMKGGPAEARGKRKLGAEGRIPLPCGRSTAVGSITKGPHVTPDCLSLISGTVGSP